jgi:hypothetical protein
MNEANYRTWIDLLIEWSRSESRALPIEEVRRAIDAYAKLCDWYKDYEIVFDHLESLLSYAGENNLLESADNRVRELEELKAKVAQLRAALELNQSFLSSLEKINPDASCSQLMKQNETALVISTTDSAWTKPLYNTLGLLRAARSHLPQSGHTGSFPIALDKEIERLEKLLARDEQSFETVTAT